MALLALDWSSPRLSLAVASGSATLEITRFQGPDAIGFLEQFLQEHGVSAAELEEVRVGVGPGNFSGTRLSIAWALGLAAPGGVRLRGVSSLGLMSARLLAAGEDSFAILGDARRGMWWGSVTREGRAGPLMLRAPEAWRREIEGLPRYSPEPQRLLSGGVEAVWLTPLAETALHPQTEFCGLAPVYLHGAVDEKMDKPPSTA